MRTSAIIRVAKDNKEGATIIPRFQSLTRKQALSKQPKQLHPNANNLNLEAPPPKAAHLPAAPPHPRPAQLAKPTTFHKKPATPRLHPANHRQRCNID